MSDLTHPLLARLDEEIARSDPDWPTLLRWTVEALADAFEHYHWTGIYLLDGEELVLGPYVGLPTEHQRIPLGRGICGAAASEGRSIVVDDVRADPRYLSCFLSTRSEIVVPILDGRRVIGEIDVDSDRPAAFGKADRLLLEAVAARLAPLAPPEGAR